MLKIKRKMVAVKVFFTSRNFAAGMLAAVLACAVYAVSTMTRPIYIVDGETTRVAYTTLDNPEEILKKEGIVTQEHDQISYAPPETGGYAQLSIARAFPVTLTLDGTTRRLMVTEGTVDSLLLEEGVVLGASDILNLPTAKTLESGDRVVVQRVEHRLIQEHHEIPFEQVKKSTSVLAKGRTRLLQQGVAGGKVLTYSETTIDGVPQERTLLAEDIIKRPVDQIVLVGDNSAISNLDYSAGFPLDANGVPLRYKTVLRNQVATGYYAGPSAFGASYYHGGRSYAKCMPGTVAVRTSQIPYGTKLYIRTPDGKFTYGYAIANDTGTGLMQNLIDVDLYYDTYIESALNGRRYVDIYILE